MAATLDEFEFDNVWENKPDTLRAEIVRFWTYHRAIPRGAAERRVDEVVYVAREREGDIAAVCTVALRWNEEIGARFYYFRVFVAPKWRRSRIATELAIRTRDFFGKRFESRDPEAPVGLFVEVENRYLKEVHNQAVWSASGLVFIGRTEKGHHKRVCYFPGARLHPPEEPPATDA